MNCLSQRRDGHERHEPPPSGAVATSIQTPTPTLFMSGHVPSFSSFPDFTNEGQIKLKDRKEHKSRKEKHRSRERLESSRRRRSRSRSPNESNRKNRHTSRRDEREKTSHFSEAQDEKLKTKEDRELTSLEDRHEPHAKAYFVDKRGDNMNVTYGGMHPGDIPKFHRTGST